MRRLILMMYGFLWCLGNGAHAQINLVPNPSFEDTIPCTTSFIFPSFAAIGWYAVNLTPDYYNSVYGYTCGYNCSALSSPIAIDGYAFMGFSTYTSGSANHREWTQRQLSAPLNVNKKYCVSVFVNCAHDFQYATDDISVALTSSSSVPLGFASQINNPAGNFITDTINWTLISGIMTAAGGENYITIGNFKTDANTTVVPNTPTATDPETYYFMDMVSVYELPDIEAGISDSICAGDTVHLNATCGALWPGLQYRWFPSAGLSDTTILNPVAQPGITTTYYFGLIDTTGTVPGMYKYTDSLTITVGCSGIEEYEKSSCGSMYPNPANTMAYYEIALANSETGFVQLFDLLGNMVSSTKLTQGTNKAEIDLSSLSNGVYLYKVVINNEWRASDRLIISR